MADFEKIERLGEGFFGEVWKVYDRALDVYRAVKYVPKSRIINPSEFYKEPRILLELRHENIVRIEEAGTATNGTLYIAMEYFPRGSLKDEYKGKPILLKKARRYLCNVCWGLEYAHQKGYIHRDIKPANILLKGGTAKLSDFGLATHAPRGTVASPYGYLIHLAPEVFQSGVTSVLTDIYALGVCAYRLCNGDSYLSFGLSDNELEDAIVSGDYPDRKYYRSHVPRSIRVIINKAMHVNPTKRYRTASEFRNALENVSIKCDWGWKHRKNNLTYRAKVNNKHIKVNISEGENGKFNIVTTKRVNTGRERKICCNCFENLTKTKMKSILHKILSKYVTCGQ